MYEDNNYYHSQELAGGELAARLSPQMRMELVQRGYDPMNPDDVRAWQSKQRPTGGLSEIAGVDTHKSMGDHGTFIDGKYITYNDKKDYGILAGEGKDVIDYTSLNQDSRSQMKANMDTYSGGDVNERIMSKLGTRQQMPLSKQLPGAIQEKPTQKKTAIAQPKQLPQAKPQLLTEAAKANQLGYTKGVKYINAFIENIKNPTNQNREALILEMNRMVAVEEKIHPSVLQAYRNGIAKAEADLYKKIKSKQ